jgi:hypothetical protein
MPLVWKENGESSLGQGCKEGWWKDFSWKPFSLASHHVLWQLHMHCLTNTKRETEHDRATVRVYMTRFWDGENETFPRTHFFCVLEGALLDSVDIACVPKVLALKDCPRKGVTLGDSVLSTKYCRISWGKHILLNVIWTSVLEEMFSCFRCIF